MREGEKGSEREENNRVFIQGSMSSVSVDLCQYQYNVQVTDRIPCAFLDK